MSSPVTEEGDIGAACVAALSVYVFLAGGAVLYLLPVHILVWCIWAGVAVYIAGRLTEVCGPFRRAARYSCGVASGREQENFFTSGGSLPLGEFGLAIGFFFFLFFWPFLVFRELAAPTWASVQQKKVAQGWMVTLIIMVLTAFLAFFVWEIGISRTRAAVVQQPPAKKEVRRPLRPASSPYPQPRQTRLEWERSEGRFEVAP